MQTALQQRPRPLYLAGPETGDRQSTGNTEAEDRKGYRVATHLARLRPELAHISSDSLHQQRGCLCSHLACPHAISAEERPWLCIRKISITAPSSLNKPMLLLPSLRAKVRHALGSGLTDVKVALGGVSTRGELGKVAE